MTEPLHERFPLNEWIEAVEELETQMGYEDWCKFRQMQEDAEPLAEVWIQRRTSDGRLLFDHFESAEPTFPAIPGYEWVKFIEPPF